MRPPTGPVYSTLARFEEDEKWPHEAWSVAVSFIRPLGGDRYLHAEISFLNDDSPTHLLQQGSRFELFEGQKRVAKGVVLPPSVEVPEEINDFESALLG